MNNVHFYAQCDPFLEAVYNVICINYVKIVAKFTYE